MGRGGLMMRWRLGRWSLCALVLGVVGFVFVGAPGAMASPVVISSVADLQNIQNNLSGAYVLGSDIDASGTPNWNGGSGFQPIGSNPFQGGAAFTGTFDGLGYTIHGLTINRPSTDIVGLFGYVIGYTGGGDVRNVRLTNVSIAGGSCVGGLVGYSDTGHISKVSVTGSVQGTDSIGGLIGCGGAYYGYSSLTTSYATSSVTGTSYVGGLVGGGIAIENSYATGTVTGTSYVGGLAGGTGATVSSSYAAGAVQGSSNVGGLIGGSGATVTNSYWDTQTSGQPTSGGGTGLTTTQLQSGVLPSGFDPSVWTAAPGGYPMLNWQSANTYTCNLAISPSSQTFTSAAGTGSVSVTASATSCAWTATSSLDWATITSGASGTGSGTVTISVAVNTTGDTRTGTITIAGKTFMITQSANTFTVTPSAGAGGSISPSTPQTVAQGSTTTFTVTPTTGYSIASVTGCGGTISGITYTTGPITADCTVAASFTQSSSKYTDNNNGTITDNTTGLTWQKGENPATYNWFQAAGTYDATYNVPTQNVCGSLSLGDLGGYSGWRLPSVTELQSLADTSFNPTIDTNFFPKAHAGSYWSAITDGSPTPFAWSVNFNIGFVSNDPKLLNYYVRCVRGGQSWLLGNNLTILEQDDTSDTDYNKTPLILVHGIHGSFDANHNGTLDFTEASIDEKGKDYWANFKSYFNSIQIPLTYSPLKNKYKLYIFSYLSDIDTVQNIAAGLNTRIKSAITTGQMKDGKIVILAHSMGGLVARSYMQEYSGSARIDKLITLATPHHGSPGANDKKALTYNGIIAEENFIAAQYLYYTFGTSAPSYIQSNEPNRSDLRWDNYSEAPVTVQDYDKNQWLSKLNADSSNDNKIIAYYGYIDPTRSDYKVALDDVSSSAFDVVALVAFKNDHIRLLIMSALISGALKNTSLLLWNDGMAPWESGSFYGHNTVAKKVSCLDYDHLDMLDGKSTTCSPTGKTLFDSVKDDLLSSPGSTSCTYTIKPASKTFTSKKGNVVIDVTAKGDSCTLSPTDSYDWITAALSGKFTQDKKTKKWSGKVKVEVTENKSSAARTGTVDIGGQTFTVTQSGVPCTLKISPETTKKPLAGAGGTDSFKVTTPDGCNWTATPDKAAWLTISSGSSGSGNGTVSYTASANTGKKRTGKINVVTSDKKSKKVFTAVQNKK